MCFGAYTKTTTLHEINTAAKRASWVQVLFYFQGRLKHWWHFPVWPIRNDNGVKNTTMCLKIWGREDLGWFRKKTFGVDKWGCLILRHPHHDSQSALLTGSAIFSPAGKKSMQTLHRTLSGSNKNFWRKLPEINPCSQNTKGSRLPGPAATGQNDAVH